MSPRVPLDEAASAVEVKEAYEALSAAERVKISKYLSVRACIAGCSKEELLNEVLSRILDPEGRTFDDDRQGRRWRKGEIPFFIFLRGAIRSVSSNMATEREQEQAELSPDGTEIGEWTENRRNLSLGNRAVLNEAMSELRAHFKNFPLSLDIIEGLEEGMKREDLLQVLDLDDLEYDRRVKQIRRRAKKLREKGMI